MNNRKLKDQISAIWNPALFSIKIYKLYQVKVVVIRVILM